MIKLPISALFQCAYLGPDNIRFNSFVGNDKIVTPLKIYDDGEQTMIQFINNNESIPEINIVDNDGGEQKLNYVIKNGLVIVPAVASQFSFRLNQSVICVFNNNIINNLRPQ